MWTELSPKPRPRIIESRSRRKKEKGRKQIGIERKKKKALGQKGGENFVPLVKERDERPRTQKIRLPRQGKFQTEEES